MEFWSYGVYRVEGDEQTKYCGPHCLNVYMMLVRQSLPCFDLLQIQGLAKGGFAFATCPHEVLTKLWPPVLYEGLAHTSFG